MNVHEFQAKEILKKYGVKIPPYRIVTTIEDARRAAGEMGLEKAIIKVQVHAGGRGKAGGVKFAQSPEEVLNFTEELLGMKIVNNQTGPEGVVAHKVMIAELTEINNEYYVGAIVDRHNAAASLIISPEGGMEIEEIAQTMPEKLKTVPIGSDGSLTAEQLTEIADFMEWQGKTAEQGKKTLEAVAKAFLDTDASLLEINPLVETVDGDIIAVDAKLSIDDNALYRQPELAACYDPSQIPLKEAQAKKHDLAYVSLDGDIGCMVNGAGLAMATMDIIQYAGGKPANFLDVGGGADIEKVTEGFKIILSDPNVKAILVNIFGGIMNCATVAEAVVSAVKQLGLEVPLVVRMEGTNVEEARKILSKSMLNIIVADGLADAAEKVVGARNALQEEEA